MNRVEPIKDLYKFDQYNINGMRLPCMFQLMVKQFFVNFTVQVILPVQKYVAEEAAGTCLIVGQN